MPCQFLYALLLDVRFLQQHIHLGLARQSHIQQGLVNATRHQR